MSPVAIFDKANSTGVNHIIVVTQSDYDNFKAWITCKQWIIVPHTRQAESVNINGACIVPVEEL